ncbi:tRNA ligase [Elasticomyces elasticus]|nr:tRNA ligase [Elasticomyces elasticus]
MAHRDQAPYAAQDVHEVAQVLSALEEHQGKGKDRGGFSCKKHTYLVNGTKGLTVDSWKFMDWDYKKPNLPTYARGLFTFRNSKGEPEIIARGYDKFFNQGETRDTEWPNVEKNTRGPYELSVKENGCIIFISGLEDGTLLVCSKHSTGPRDNDSANHALAGEAWVDKHVQSVGKTRQGLARKLREMNATAVAELCDDTFEEHVLAYSPQSAGLYLHGINLNIPEFTTYPGHLVDQFATEWGFKKTMYIMEDDINKVKTFLGETAETGSYAGRETEGFVIRCQARASEGAPWHDWFFKYKFEEPYLMYRQWRECTKAVIGDKQPKYKKHKKITEEYLLFARKMLHQNKDLAKQYINNHGIIKLRDDFLASRGLKGSDIIRQEIEGGEVANDAVTKDVVLVPIATIGCGKTTVAIALAKLFDWGHIQNDNIQGKQRPPRFATAVCNALSQHMVTIADRNNSQRRERAQIVEDVRHVIPDAHFVALHYVHDHSNINQIRDTTRQRVLSRGDNHQTIQAGSKSQDEIIGIMEGFINRFEPVNTEVSPDDAFDLVINLNATATSRENLETVVAQMNAEYPKLFGKMPTSDELDAAIEAALADYKPDIKHEIKGGKPNQRNKTTRGQNGTHKDSMTPQPNGAKPAVQKPLEYFCIKLPTTRITTILDAIFRDEDAQIARVYRQLQQQRRVQREFHVTLIHRASASQHQQYWDRLSELYFSARDDARNAKQPPQNRNGTPSQSDEPELGKCNVILERVVWDARIMCFLVRLAPAKTEGEGTEMEWRSVNEMAHITVGTANQSVKPKESNDLLKRWMTEGSGGESGIRDVPVKGQVELLGVVNGVFSR